MVVGRFVVSVVNIPWTVSRHELGLYFSQFGCVKEAFVKFNKLGLHQGYGDVRFLKEEDMNTVLERKHTLEGKDLVVFRKKIDRADNNTF